MRDRGAATHHRERCHARVTSPHNCVLGRVLVRDVTHVGRRARERSREHVEAVVRCARADRARVAAVRPPLEGG